MIGGIRHSIAYRMTFSILVFSCVLTAVSAMGLYKLNYDEVMDSIEKDLQQLNKTNIPSISASLWVMDMQQLDIQLNSLLNIPHLTYVKIEANDKVLASAGTNWLGSSVSRSFPLQYNYDNRSIHLGTIKIQIYLEDIYKELFTRTYIRLLFEAGQIFLVAVFIILIFRRIISRRISVIEHHLSALDTGRLDAPLVLPKFYFFSGEDELDHVARVVNRMGSNLKDSFQELETEKERLAVTLRSIGDGVITTDTQGLVVLMNKVAEELTGFTCETAAGRPLSEVFNIINENTRKTCENPVDKVLETENVVELANHTALIRVDGSEIVIADSAAPIRDSQSKIIGVVLVFRDITSQYRLETEMQRMQKLESLGLLAGGIAHDFNNLLTAIMGNISLAGDKLPPDHPAADRLANAEKATQRATNLTQQLLTFAKGGAPIKSLARVDEVAKEAIDFALSGSSIKAEYDVPASLWHVEIDQGQIAQVFNNLTINSIHSTPDGGVIAIRFENISILPDELPGVPSGDYVKISFKDHGAGIPEEHLSKIFDPYFTTKDQGHGLGLATVFSILNKHGGYITVDSEVGVGATFFLYLPASKKSVDRVTSKTATLCAGAGRVLIMDDEAMIRDMAGEILNALGYEAGFAEGGAQALSEYILAQKDARPYSAVIMDLTIPGGMGGEEAVKRLLEIDPQANVIVSSGYSNDPIMSDYRRCGFKGVLVKPYNVDQMGEVLSRLSKELRS